MPTPTPTPTPTQTPTPAPSLKVLRSGAQDSGTTLASNRGGVELIKQAGQKQQKFSSYSDYIRYLKAVPYVQNKG